MFWKCSGDGCKSNIYIGVQKDKVLVSSSYRWVNGAALPEVRVILLWLVLIHRYYCAAFVMKWWYATQAGKSVPESTVATQSVVHIRTIFINRTHTMRKS
jgi:hypothetical protein